MSQTILDTRRFAVEAANVIGNILPESGMPFPPWHNLRRDMISVIQARIDAAIADVFERMPVPPEDMASPEGLAAYAEATLEWRTQMGYPAQYDGPVGPTETPKRDVTTLFDPPADWVPKC